MKLRALAALAALLIASACALADSPPTAGVEAAQAPLPWTRPDFLDDPEEFTFAVVSDLQGGYTEGVFEAAVSKLNRLRPEFVMSVGDLIPGYSDDRSELVKMWDAFDRRLAPLAMRFFYTVGNHDIGNR